MWAIGATLATETDGDDKTTKLTHRSRVTPAQVSSLVRIVLVNSSSGNTEIA